MTAHNLQYITDISVETQQAMSDCRSAAELMENHISKYCKDSREASIAYTKLEECLMWTIKSLAVHGCETPLGEPTQPEKLL